MRKTDKHIIYAKNCRQMFVGQIIRAVIYGELKQFADENNTVPEPLYKTKYPDIDSLDLSIYFKTNNKAVYVFWDNTFICYGLQSELVDLTKATNDYEQKWDVSDEEKWKSIIGQKITDFKILWEETWISNIDGSNKVYITYPQTFEIATENGKIILISASDFVGTEKNKIELMIDNLLVTTNVDLAKQLKITG